MIHRYALHVGKGRSWQTDPSLPRYEHQTSDDHKELGLTARSMQEDIDWWIIFDTDDGMSLYRGWSTGRSTPKLMEIDRAFVVLRPS